MKNNGRRFWVLMIPVGLILILGTIFWPLVLENIIFPLAKTIWLLLRISILSIDQKYYWGGFILIIILLITRRLEQETVSTVEDELPEQNDTLKNIEFWSTCIKYSPNKEDQEKVFKTGLSHLLVTAYTSDQHALSNYEVAEALKSQTIPLPENIYQILFADEKKHAKRSFINVLKSLWLFPKKQMDRWSKRNIADHYQKIDEVLTFLETSLEIKNDDEQHARFKH